MSDNPETVRQALECLNSGDLDGYFSLFSPDAHFVGYLPDVPPNVAGVRAFHAALLGGIASFYVEPIDLFAAGERVVLRYNVTGDHMGQLMGRRGSGHSIAFEGVMILYFQDGKVQHCVVRADDIALLTQLGIIETPSSTGA